MAKKETKVKKQLISKEPANTENKDIKVSKKFISIKTSYVFYSLLAIFGVAIIVLSFELIFWERYYPQVYVANVAITALSPTQATNQINQTIKPRLNQQINLNYQGQEYKFSLSSDDTSINLDKALKDAYVLGRQKPYFSPQNLNLEIEFSDQFNKKLALIGKNVNQPAVDSQIKLDGDQINVTPSQNGLELDQDLLKQKISTYINTGKIVDSNLPIKTTYPKLSYDSAIQIKGVLDEVKLNPINLVYGEQKWELDLAQVLSLIDLSSSQSSIASANILNHPITISSAKVGSKEFSDSKLVLNSKKLDTYLSTIAGAIDRPVAEPLFNFDGKRVVEFRPPTIGRKLNKTLAESLINNALVSKNQKVVNLPVDEFTPKNKLSNELGIKEVIGVGESNFAESIVNRIYNVNLGASKINGVLIAPGEEFSFNKTVGDISAATGFKQAYVIKSGRTVLDDGGGICQISTTLFRAALDAGLPITARTAHAYRVHYYEEGGYPPGIDATIFYPSVDFKFKNDTPASILIQTTIVGTALTINLYGTSDGRVASISKPVILSSTPPPAELRQDDPTLPRGTVKQVDFSAWGANVVFNRTVTRNGETLIKETFRSNYRPWQAIFLVGTKDG